eukprot:g61238.t1
MEILKAFETDTAEAIVSKFRQPLTPQRMTEKKLKKTASFSSRVRGFSSSSSARSVSESLNGKVEAKETIAMRLWKEAGKPSSIPDRHWCTASAADVFVRYGPNYQRQGNKGCSGPALYELMHVDCFTYSQKIPHIARYLDLPDFSWETRERARTRRQTNLNLDKNQDDTDSLDESPSPAGADDSPSPAAADDSQAGDGLRAGRQSLFSEADLPDSSPLPHSRSHSTPATPASSRRPTPVVRATTPTGVKYVRSGSGQSGISSVRQSRNKNCSLDGSRTETEWRLFRTDENVPNGERTDNNEEEEEGGSEGESPSVEDEKKFSRGIVGVEEEEEAEEEGGTACSDCSPSPEGNRKHSPGAMPAETDGHIRAKASSLSSVPSDWIKGIPPYFVFQFQAPAAVESLFGSHRIEGPGQCLVLIFSLTEATREELLSPSP